MTVGVDYIIETCPTLTFEELLALTNYKQTEQKMLSAKSDKEFKQFKRKYKNQLVAISSALSISDIEQRTLEYVIFQFKSELNMLAYDQKIGSAYCGGYFDAVYFMVRAASKEEEDIFNKTKGWDEVHKLLDLMRLNYTKECK